MYRKCIETYTQHKTMSVVIPCIPRHVQYLKDVLNSIQYQTVLPQTVIIALSETNKNDCFTLQKKYQNLYQNFNIIFSCVGHKAYAAENRNRGASIVKTDYITFIDADDLMVNNKIQIILNMFNSIDTDFILHTIGHQSTDKIIHNDEIQSVYKEGTQNYIESELFEIDNIINHGHISIKTHIYNTFKQSDNIKYRRGEDSEFIKRLLHHKIKMTLIDTELTKYREELSSENN